MRIGIVELLSRSVGVGQSSHRRDLRMAVQQPV